MCRSGVASLSTAVPFRQLMLCNYDEDDGDENDTESHSKWQRCDANIFRAVVENSLADVSIVSNVRSMNNFLICWRDVRDAGAIE